MTLAGLLIVPPLLAITGAAAIVLYDRRIEQFIAALPREYIWRQEATRIAGAVTLAAGILALLILLRAARGLATYTWEATTGTITASRIRHFSGRNNRASYRWELTYQYQVDGTAYVSQRLNTGFAWLIHTLYIYGWYQVRRWPPGQSVTVYYAPGRPRQAVLERGVPVYTLLAASAYLAVGYLALVVNLIGVVLIPQ